jgi:predicted dehydrogenase
MPEKLRVGIIGLGWGLSVHLPALRSIPEFEVVALCSRTREKVEEAALENNIPCIYTDFQEMIEAKDIDIISIATPVQSHYPIALAAVRQGKHVICEKPLTLNETESRNLYLAAKESGVSHVVCHEMRWIPERLALKDLIVKEDYLGEPYFIQLSDTVPFWHPSKPTQHEWLYKENMGGGYLLALVSHDIDFLHSLFGDIVAVNAQVVTSIKKRTKPNGEEFEQDADDTSILNLRFKNGAVGVLSSSSMALHAPRLRLEAYGSKGSIIYTMDNHWNSRIEIGNVEDSGLHQLEPSIRQPQNPITLTAKFDADFARMQGGVDRIKATNEKAVRAMTLLCEDFLESIRNQTPIHPSFLDGMKIQQIIEAAKESEKTGQWIEISSSI